MREKSLKCQDSDPEIIDAIAAMDEFFDPIDEYEQQKLDEARDHYWDVMLRHLDSST